MKVRVTVAKKKRTLLSKCQLAIFVDERFALTLGKHQGRTFVFHRPAKIQVKWGLFTSSQVTVVDSCTLTVGLNYWCFFYLVGLIVLLSFTFTYPFFRGVWLVLAIIFAWYSKQSLFRLKKVV